MDYFRLKERPIREENDTFKVPAAGLTSQAAPAPEQTALPLLTRGEGILDSEVGGNGARVLRSDPHPVSSWLGVTASEDGRRIAPLIVSCVGWKGGRSWGAEF